MADDNLDRVGYESEAPPKPMAKRLDKLAGKTMGILDIGFPNGSVFLDRVEEVLKSRYGVTQFLRHAKPSPARPADGHGLVPILALQLAKVRVPRHCRTTIQTLAYDARGGPSERSTFGNAWSSAGARK